MPGLLHSRIEIGPVFEDRHESSCGSLIAESAQHPTGSQTDVFLNCLILRQPEQVQMGTYSGFDKAITIHLGFRSVIDVGRLNHLLEIFLKFLSHSTESPSSKLSDWQLRCRLPGIKHRQD